MFRHRTIAALCIAGSCVVANHATGQVVMPGSTGRRAIDPKVREQALNHHRNGWRALGAEDWETAREHFTSALRLVETFPMAYYGLGKAHMGLKTYDDAITAFTTCRDQYRMMAGAEFNSQLESKQRRQDQIQELRSVIRELQSAPATTRSTASAGRQIRDLQTYLRQLEDADKSGLSTSPDLAVPAEVFLSLGSAHFRANHLSEAEAEYLNAVKAKPDFGEALNNLAVLSLMAGRTSDAEEYVRKAEKSGYRVNPQLKDDIKAAKGSD